MALTGEAYSMKIVIEGQEYEVPCRVSRILIEDEELSSTWEPVAPVWKLPRG